jgi:hypothetical protein
LSPDLTVDIETCLAPAENFLNQREDLMGKKIEDAGKPAHRIATVEIFLNDILDDGTEIAVLLLNPGQPISKTDMWVFWSPDIRREDYIGSYRTDGRPYHTNQLIHIPDTPLISFLLHWITFRYVCRINFKFFLELLSAVFRIARISIRITNIIEAYAVNIIPSYDFLDNANSIFPEFQMKRLSPTDEFPFL